MNILMCKPQYYNIDYEINPWMNKKVRVKHQNASLQWQTLRETIMARGIKVELIEPVAGLPDLVFTANAALVIEDVAYLSHFHYPERQPETIHNRAWFSKHAIRVDDYAVQHDIKFEGAGDALLAGDTLFAGYGFRSEKRYFHYLESALSQKIIYCELVDPYFYHLDTCFCPLDAYTAIWWPGAFSRSAQKAIRAAIDVIDVSHQEARLFCCNAVVHQQNVILPEGCLQLKEALQKIGFHVFDCNMGEFIKSGGACKCLTLEY